MVTWSTRLAVGYRLVGAVEYIARPRSGSVRQRTDDRKGRERPFPIPSKAMPSPKPIQLILARQLASSLAMPILIMDREGTLVFYNEPAEAILDLRFDETGEMSADEWGSLIAVADNARRRIAPENHPTMLALSERKPINRTIWMQCRNREWRHVNITAIPLIGEGKQFLGAQMIFWEV